VSYVRSQVSWHQLNFYAFGQCQRILNIHAKIPNSILYLCMPQKDLHGAQVAGRFIDDRRFCSSQGVCAIILTSEVHGSHPFVDKSRILACAHVRRMIHPARKGVILNRSSSPLQPCKQASTSIRHQFELHRPTGLLLNYDRSSAHFPARDEIPILIFNRSHPRSLLSIARSKSARSRSRCSRSRWKRIAHICRGFNGRFAPTFLPAFQAGRGDE